jgi:hypothetical protein
MYSAIAKPHPTQRSILNHGNTWRKPTDRQRAAPYSAIQTTRGATIRADITSKPSTLDPSIFSYCSSFRLSQSRARPPSPQRTIQLPFHPIRHLQQTLLRIPKKCPVLLCASKAASSTFCSSTKSLCGAGTPARVISRQNASFRTRFSWVRMRPLPDVPPSPSEPLIANQRNRLCKFCVLDGAFNRITELIL